MGLVGVSWLLVCVSVGGESAGSEGRSQFCYLRVRVFIVCERESAIASELCVCECDLAETRPAVCKSESGHVRIYR